MQALLGTRLFTRVTQCVALWFALALTAAAASPLIQPRQLEVICSASGVFKLIVKGDGGGKVDHDAHRSIDCALCLPTSAPPPASEMKVAAGIVGAAYALPDIPSPSQRHLALAPPPRGPPSVLFV